MNDDARRNIENAVNNLKQVKQLLTDASNNVENGNVKIRIENQLNGLENCLKECQGIASGLAQE